MGFFTKLLSMGEDKPLKNYQKVVEGINALEPLMEAKSDEELSHMTVELRERLDHGETLDDVLPEAFAAVREASKRTLGLRHFDVQLIGGMALHDGKIAEMKTGEGKTLVSTLAGYLNALPGNNVHIVTVNDYLAARGEGALDALVKGYFGQDTENPTELDAQVAYRRSWNRALNEAFAAASILYADGTEDDLAALFENEQSFFSPALVETLESAGIYSFEAALKRPVSLPAVRAIRVLDVEIPLNK